MPRYHFNAADGHDIPDPEGTLFADDEAARDAGLAYLAEILLEEPHLLWASGAFQMTVTDAAGLSLFVFDLGVTTSTAAGVPPPAGGRRRKS